MKEEETGFSGYIQDLSIVIGGEEAALGFGSCTCFPVRVWSGVRFLLAMKIEITMLLIFF
ncbi:hypothetical protein CSV80_05470 [Sporosarcina sp. P12(2017)]|nr:hypothetical protein [Sporosarcina sp. P12(2017)]PIC61472.1 hypothetical protein CSV80_05470 [Sporosarcina sp. P12(2017)]